MSHTNPINFNILPLKRSITHHTLVNQDNYQDDLFEPRPGLESEGDAFDNLYSSNNGENNQENNNEEPKYEILEDEYIDEYHPTNMKFWWYMIIALFFIVLVVASEYTGVTKDWFKDLDLPPGARNNEIIAIGNIFFILIITWIAYHVNTSNNSNGYKQGSTFFLGISYVFFLAWIASMYGDTTARNASLFLVFLIVLMAIAMWVIWPLESFENKRYVLAIASVWLIYLLYFNLGVVVLNDCNNTGGETGSKYKGKYKC